MTHTPGCPCHSCRPRPLVCACCGGTGKVTTADGWARPCSRCRSDEFHRWADERRPKAPPAPLFPFKSGGGG